MKQIISDEIVLLIISKGAKVHFYKGLIILFTLDNLNKRKSLVKPTLFFTLCRVHSFVSFQGQCTMHTTFLSPGDVINGGFTLESKSSVFSVGRVSFLLHISISSSLRFPLPNKCSLSQGGRLVTCSDKLFHFFRTQPLYFTPYANENTSLMIRKR